MAAGRLRARSRLITTYIGRTFEAELLADGRILLDGETYSSPSGAGVAVKIALGGPDQPRSVLSTDGWSFWRALDELAGDLVPLKEIRSRADAEGS